LYKRCRQIDDFRLNDARFAPIDDAVAQMEWVMTGTQQAEAESASRKRKHRTGAERVRAGEPTATDEVVMKIRQWLATGRIVPGQRLTEADLSRDLGVSKSPVREAMQRLAADGVVVTAPYKGYLIYRMTRSEVAGVFDVMEVTDGLAARLAAENIRDGASPDLLKSALEEFNAAHFEVGRVADNGNEENLQKAFMALSANTMLEQISERIRYSVFPLQFRTLQLRGIPGSILDLVRVFVEAILVADPKQAEAAAKAHVRALRDHMLSLPDEWFEPEADER
jgi:DNA-binding GntR family transcriptional regulator